jgi:hypothetical protein
MDLHAYLWSVERHWPVAAVIIGVLFLVAWGQLRHERAPHALAKAAGLNIVLASAAFAGWAMPCTDAQRSWVLQGSILGYTLMLLVWIIPARRRQHAREHPQLIGRGGGRSGFG